MTWRQRLGQRAKRDEVGTTATLPFLMHSAQTLAALGFGQRPDCIHTTNGSGKSSLVAPRRCLPAEAVVLRSTVHSSAATPAQWALVARVGLGLPVEGNCEFRLTNHRE